MARSTAAGRGRTSATHNLVLVGGDRPRLRKASKRDWTKAKERAFLSVLASTCNVTQAAAEASVSVTQAYRRRRCDAAFRAAWLEAIGVAYQRLELVLLERAFNGTEKIVERKDGSVERMVEYSNQLALTLLKMHRDTAIEAEAEVPEEEAAEARERLLNKLERLRRRQEETARIETEPGA